MPSRPLAAGPSPWWAVVTVLTATLAITAATLAVIHQSRHGGPIGEGQLFYADAARARAELESALATGEPPPAAVRRVRNQLGVEAVALVDGSGAVTAATSPSLVGETVSNPVLTSALGGGRFGAVAAPLERPILIDGVTEWNPGAVLYTVIDSDPSGRNLLFFYDFGELRGRRARSEGLQPLTLQLAGVAFALGSAALLTLVGRSRAVRRYREMRLEAAHLRRQSQALQVHNAELREARSEAERALALAEEKNRIRSEFVLMINHELRTPLTSVVTGGQLLSSSPGLDREERAILGDLIHDAQRLQEMIDQLLTLARVENRSLAFRPRPVSLAEAWSAGLSAHSRVAPVPTGDDGPIEGTTVLTDLQTLTQLVASLVDNAYTHGARSVRVGCETPDDEPDLVVGETPAPAAALAVIDDGPGIRPGFLPRAFEKFEKDSRSSGTGLGLYMARMMAEAMGAALHVWTGPAGTTIAIVMPRVPLPEAVAV